MAKAWTNEKCNTLVISILHFYFKQNMDKAFPTPLIIPYPHIQCALFGEGFSCLFCDMFF
jgi:hypothetical protein